MKKFIFILTIIIICIAFLHNVITNSREIEFNITNSTINDNVNELSTAKNIKISSFEDSSEIFLTSDGEIYKYSGEKIGTLDSNNSYTIQNGYIYTSKEAFSSDGKLLYSASGTIQAISKSGVLIDRRIEDDVSKGQVAIYKIVDLQKNNKVITEGDTVYIYFGQDDFFKKYYEVYYRLNNENGNYLTMEEHAVNSYELIDLKQNISYGTTILNGIDDIDVNKIYGINDFMENLSFPADVGTIASERNNQGNIEILSLDKRLIYDFLRYNGTYRADIRDFNGNILKDISVGGVSKVVPFEDEFYVITETGYIYGLDGNLNNIFEARRIDSSNVVEGKMSKDSNEIIKDYGKGTYSLKSGKFRSNRVYYNNHYFYYCSGVRKGANVYAYNTKLEEVYEIKNIPMDKFNDKRQRIIMMKDFLVIGSSNNNIYLLNGENRYEIKNAKAQTLGDEDNVSSKLLTIKKGSKTYILNMTNLEYIK